MSDRLGRPCLFVASGRLSLYLAFRYWLNPGDRILMSPINDDVIFFTALAAGLRPVMAPVSSEDGNIELSLVRAEAWGTIDGVLTTNLYGLPDRVRELHAKCTELRIPLIEDAAHAIQTDVDGRPIGTFGDAAAFSLSKHVGAPCGGILAFSDGRSRRDLERLRDAVTVSGRLPRSVLSGSTHMFEEIVIRLGLVWPARFLRRGLGLTERRPGLHRMPLREVDLRAATALAPGLEPFHAWIRVDRRDYNVRPTPFLLGRALRGLRALSRDRARRVEGVDRLRALPIAATSVREGDPQPLFRVPLLVEHREQVISRLERHIVGIGYIYDPPLDDYAGPDFAEPNPEPRTSRSWARKVLPVDPLEAEAVMRLIR